MATSLPFYALSSGVTTLATDYQPATFYTSGTDKRGHREEVRCYFPQDIHGRMCALVGSDKLPYKTLGDLPRDAVYHRLVWLEEHIDDPALQQDVQVYLSLENSRRAKARIAAEKELIDETQEALRDTNQNFYLSADELRLRVEAINTPALRQQMQELVERYV